MANYRSSMQIVSDLLVATEQSGLEGIKTTHLLTKANLSHSRLAKFTENLTGWNSIIGVSIKRRNLQIFQRQGWNSIQKEQVRSRQYDKCNMCFTPPTKWKYDYIDGNKNNNDLNNCQGLCSDCISIKTERDNRLSIYQKSN